MAFNYVYTECMRTEVGRAGVERICGTNHYRNAGAKMDPVLNCLFVYVHGSRYDECNAG
jgi:hypothetical protein